MSGTGEVDHDEDKPGDSSKKQHDVRPTRKAMVKARQKLQQWLSLDPDEASVGSVAARDMR